VSIGSAQRRAQRPLEKHLPIEQSSHRDRSRDSGTRDERLDAITGDLAERDAPATRVEQQEELAALGLGLGKASIAESVENRERIVVEANERGQWMKSSDPGLACIGRRGRGVFGHSTRGNAKAVDSKLERKHFAEIRVVEQTPLEPLPQESAEPLGLRSELEIRRSTFGPEPLGFADERIPEKEAGEWQVGEDWGHPVDTMERAARRHPRLPDDRRQPLPLSCREGVLSERALRILTDPKAELGRRD